MLGSSTGEGCRRVAQEKGAGGSTGEGCEEKVFRVLLLRLSIPGLSWSSGRSGTEAQVSPGAYSTHYGTNMFVSKFSAAGYT